jgi:peptidoglycan L-alanyl-D-glutamate endopeptidase CwlK
MNIEYLRRIEQSEVTPEMGAASQRILNQNRTKPFGTRIPFIANGNNWIAVVERHWDATRGPHPGISLFEPLVDPIINELPIKPFFLGSRSLKNLIGVDDNLIKVIKRAIQITKIDFTVIEGLRSKERQAQLVAEGKSQTMNSRHLTGDAVDIAPWVKGVISWAWSDFHKLAPFIQAAANELDINVQWGGNWPGFSDGPHWQIPWETK